MLRRVRSRLRPPPSSSFPNFRFFNIAARGPLPAAPRHGAPLPGRRLAPCSEISQLKRVARRAIACAGSCPAPDAGSAQATCNASLPSIVLRKDKSSGR
jgi:hypothetical protein